MDFPTPEKIRDVTVTTLRYLADRFESGEITAKNPSGDREHTIVRPSARCEALGDKVQYVRTGVTTLTLEYRTQIPPADAALLCRGVVE